MQKMQDLHTNTQKYRILRKYRIFMRIHPAVKMLSKTHRLYNQGCGSSYFVNHFRFHTYRFHFQQSLESNKAWTLCHL